MLFRSPSSRPPLVRLLLIALGLLVLVWATSLGAVLAWERNDQARPVSAIVVLGAAQYVGRPSPVLRARLDHAIALFHRRLAPLRRARTALSSRAAGGIA